MYTHPNVKTPTGRQMDRRRQASHTDILEIQICLQLNMEGKLLVKIEEAIGKGYNATAHSTDT